MREAHERGVATYAWCRLELARLDEAQALSLLFTDAPLPRALRLAAQVVIDGGALAFGPPCDWRWAYARARLLDGREGRHATETREEWWAEEIEEGATNAKPAGFFYSRFSGPSKIGLEWRALARIDQAMQEADNVYERTEERQREATGWVFEW